MTAFGSLLLLAALSANDDTVLVQFTSQNCTHCQAMQPVLERMHGEGCPVQVIDVDQQPDVARQFQIKGVPTFVVLTRGQETGRVMGAASYERLTQLYRGMVPVAGGREQAAPTLPAEEPTPAQPKFAPSYVTERETAPREPAQRGPAQFVSAPAQAAAAPANVDPQGAAMAATVRLKVEDAKGYGYGTGTIIDVHDEEALVVTCGHLFRESQGKGKISVEMFAPGATQPVDGQLIAYDLQRDIALVSIRPGMPMVAVMVAPPGTTVRPQDAAFTIGCDKGAAASVRQTQITAVNKYVGKPNYCAAGAPVDGRSGGGLFTADGLLIGICNAADPADDEGLYAGLASIHWQLDEIGQAEIYQRAAQSPAAVVADTRQPSQPNRADEQPASALAAAPLPSLPAAMPSREASVAVTPAVYQPATAPDAVAPAGFESPVAGGDDTEIVFIIRSKSNPQQRSEVFVVDGATPDLVGRISEAARATGQRRAAQAAARVAPISAGPAGTVQTAHRDRSRESTIVRGQSSDY
jgi:thiol-disulfide isomerase/thioredoxin